MEINDAFCAASLHMPLIDYGPQHQESFRLVVLRQDIQHHLLNRLRWALLPRHAAVQPITGWLQLRSQAALHAPNAWRGTKDEVTEAEILVLAEERP